MNNSPLLVQKTFTILFEISYLIFCKDESLRNWGNNRWNFFFWTSILILLVSPRVIQSSFLLLSLTKFFQKYCLKYYKLSKFLIFLALMFILFHMNGSVKCYPLRDIKCVRNIFVKGNSNYPTIQLISLNTYSITFPIIPLVTDHLYW